MRSKQSLWQMTLGAFRDDIESRSMPGCGAAAAVSAATGLSLVLKGLRLSGKDKTEEGRDRLIERADRLVDRFAGYADEDVAAFKAYLAAQKNADAEDGALEAAIERINRVPLDTARACLEGLELIGDALEYTKAALHSDVRAGAELLRAGLSMVLLNVDANLDNLDDAQQRDALARERDQLRARADRLHETR